MAGVTVEDAAKEILEELKQPGTVVLAVKQYILTRLVDRLLRAEDSVPDITITSEVKEISDTKDDDGSATHTVHHEIHVGSFSIGWDTTETVTVQGAVGVTLAEWQ